MNLRKTARRYSRPATRRRGTGISRPSDVECLREPRPLLQVMARSSPTLPRAVPPYDLSQFGPSRIAQTDGDPIQRSDTHRQAVHSSPTIVAGIIAMLLSMAFFVTNDADEARAREGCRPGR